jgi:hypothetical protein
MIKKLAALGITAALAFTPMVAFAQDATPAATPAADASPMAKPMKHKMMKHKMMKHKMMKHKMMKKEPEASPTPTPSAT